MDEHTNLERAEKLRDDAAEYAMRAGETDDRRQRDQFVTLAQHLLTIADHIEKTATTQVSETFLGGKKLPSRFQSTHKI